MANRTGQNVDYIDQFNADVNLVDPSAPYFIKKIRLLSAAQWDLFLLEDYNGNVLFRMENSTGNARMTEVDFGDEGFNFGGNGLRIDVSDCTGLAATDGSDAVWIYKK